MSEQLKLVALYDAHKNQYSLLAHNLSEEAANQVVAQWPDPAVSPIAVNQRTHHKTENPQECRTCRNEVARSSGLEPKPKFTRRKE